MSERLQNCFEKSEEYKDRNSCSLATQAAVINIIFQHILLQILTLTVCWSIYYSFVNLKIMFQSNLTFHTKIA